MTVPPTHSVALLPTRTNINLHKPEENEYFDGDITYLLVRSSRSNGLTVASTYASEGNPLAGHTVGERFEAHHDQEGYTFGTMTVVGMRTRDGEILGEVPSRKVSLRVFK